MLPFHDILTHIVELTLAYLAVFTVQKMTQEENLLQCILTLTADICKYRTYWCMGGLMSIVSVLCHRFDIGFGLGRRVSGTLVSSQVHVPSLWTYSSRG